MEQKRQEALRLYLTQGRTQKEIATAVGVSEKTIYTWIQKYAWDKLRYASYQGPAMIAEKLCSQLVELQSAIDRREPGSRYPSKDESLVIHRLICDIEKMRKFPSMGVTLQVLQTFRNHVRKYDKDLARKLSNHLFIYTEEQATGGLYPLSNDFDNEKVSPFTITSEEETDYTRFYQYRVPEEEIPEEENTDTIEHQQLTSQQPLQEPEKTGSKPEVELEDDLKNILSRDIPAQLMSPESKSKREAYLEHWKKFAQSVKNDTPPPPPLEKYTGNKAA